MSEAFVRAEGVHKTYRLGETEVRALRGVNLTLRKGEFTALVGASGSGKSTLLNLLGCLDEPDQGRILFDGRDVAHLGDVERSRTRNHHIGFIFQSFNLVPVLDVFENVELPLLLHSGLSPAERRARVEQALADVSLLEFRKHWPDKLSGGQRQRVAVARALVTQPMLVLADEPTANLDSETASRLIDLMVDLNQKRQVTFLFSTHDEKLMVRVAKVVRIRDGVILES
ncbi:MAG TPA: ABC transporter ATP-binding protein [Pseudomonadota bacterium]|jgi:putative ABC transport system ATP-binding protein|nr:ABC transporter ATP-binding protein [Pseudomonadota bacterium]HNN51636.1 ABC transporter ATP-binding protein [Pseudomonadota bacterium]